MEMRLLDFNYAFQPATRLIASSEDSEYPVENLKNQIRARSWRSTSSDAQSVVIDFCTSEAVDFFSLVFDPIVGPQLSPSAVLKIQGNATNSWASPAVDVTLTLDEDFGVASKFWTSDQTYRYWRLYIDDPGSDLGYIEISKVLIGKATQFTQLPNNGFDYPIRDQSAIYRTKYGHKYVDIYPNIKVLGFNFGAFLTADLETLCDLYERIGNTRCVALALDPTEVTFDKDRFFIYGQFSGAIPNKHKVFDIFDSSFSIEESF